MRPSADSDEFVYNDVKQSLARHQPPGSKDELKSNLVSYKRSMQKLQAKVRTFFQAPTGRYAA